MLAVTLGAVVAVVATGATASASIGFSDRSGGGTAPSIRTVSTVASTPTYGPGIALGVDTTQQNFPNVIAEVGRTPALLNGFFTFVNRTGSSVRFPLAWVNNVLSLGSTPMITWQPNLPTYATTSALTSISDGSEDSYILSWAEAAKAMNHKIYLRFMHEMNGNWYPWGAVVAGTTPLARNQLATKRLPGDYPYTNTASMYVAAYDHVVNLFRQVGATNVEFVWCLSTGASIKSISQWYPGDSYIQWPAMDGYNRSATNPKSLYSLFAPGYAAITGFSHRGILIAETASVEFSGLSIDPSSKAQWITQGFLTTIPNSFPAVKAVDFWDLPVRGYTSYPFDSSSQSLEATQDVFSSPEYQTAAP